MRHSEAHISDFATDVIGCSRETIPRRELRRQRLSRSPIFQPSMSAATGHNSDSDLICGNPLLVDQITVAQVEGSEELHVQAGINQHCC